ncbi:MAG: deoxyribodipyrimidine photo-lyase [Thermodesulfobacteriota bacterium]
MIRSQVESTRIQILNQRPILPNNYVLYWMQQSQRAVGNHALEYAVELANARNKPLLVVFGLTGGYPEANARHYTFLIEGLREVRESLRARGIAMVIRLGEPDRVAMEFGKKADLMVCDRGYLRHQNRWRQEVACRALCRVVQVESDAVVPVETASGKKVYAARFLRPHIHRNLSQYLKRPIPQQSRHSSLELNLPGEDLADIDGLLSTLGVDRRVPPVSRLFQGGTSRATERMQRFVREELTAYAVNGNQPQTDSISYLSPHLHFGQISTIDLALAVQQAQDSPAESRAAFLEQLIVRRELAFNFTHYTPDYDQFASLPGWARETLHFHRQDKREFLYTEERLEQGETHDPYWNAAMLEMKHTGFMHNYMRMYWGKKILEWSESPEAAFTTIQRFNNKYFLDGRDPNSYAGCGWIFGLHDRPWKERPVFGKIRCMTAAGLERKCDMAGYVDKVKRLVQIVTA